MSKLLDIPERTLRDWKHGRNRLYTLLENLEYEDLVDLTMKKNPYSFVLSDNKQVDTLHISSFL